MCKSIGLFPVWLTSKIRSFFYTNDTTQQQNSSEVNGQSRPDTSSDSESENFYDAIEELIDPAPTDRPHVRNRRQGEPPIYPQSADDGQDSCPPQGTAPITDYEETNQEINSNRDEGASAADDDNTWNKDRGDGEVDKTPYDGDQNSPMNAAPFIENNNVNTHIHENASKK